MSGSVLPNTFRLIIFRGCSVHLMLRPACLLPAVAQTCDAPLWPLVFLPSAGACYRALRRLPGRVLHPPEERVFQDAPCAHSTNDPCESRIFFRSRIQTCTTGC
jgi:hypothetical protein